jgi:hypothetical protein
MSWLWPTKSGDVVNLPRLNASDPPSPPYNYDGRDAGGHGHGSDGDDEEPFHLCWSCRRELRDAEGVSIDESGEVQCCHACWALISPQWRLMLGLLFRRLDAGGFGIGDLIEQALREWPGMRPSRN